METEYTIHNNEKEQQLEVLLMGEKATLTYRFYKKDIAFMHTQVPPALEGRGIAEALARAAFELAKQLHRPVMVYCPFVGNFLKKHPEYLPQLDLITGLIIREKGVSAYMCGIRSGQSLFFPNGSPLVAATLRDDYAGPVWSG